MVRLCRGGWEGSCLSRDPGTGLRSESLGVLGSVAPTPSFSSFSCHPPSTSCNSPSHAVFSKQPSVVSLPRQQVSPFSPGGVGGGPGLPSPTGIGKEGRQGTCQEIPGFHEAEGGSWAPHTPQSRAQGCLLGPWGGHQEHPEGRRRSEAEP